MMKHRVKVGIIGGTGMSNIEILENRVEKQVSSIFGEPSDHLVEGTIEDVPCALLARHGRKHNLMPGKVNYRANIWALKSVGCTHVLATTACGSLKDQIHPGDIILLDSFIDRTQGRNSTFFDNSNRSLPGVCHMPMEPAFCDETRNILISNAKKLNYPFLPSGTCVTIEGPRFSSKAESRLFRSWDCDVVNMTTVPEVNLAKEAGLCYASIGLVTDYDCWKNDGAPVSTGEVVQEFKRSMGRVVELLFASIIKIGSRNWDDIIDKAQKLVVDNTIDSTW